MIYQATPDYYNDVIAHRDHKYISKHRGRTGKWIYVYKDSKFAKDLEKRPKMSDLPNPYTEMHEGMNNLRTGAKKLAIGGLRGALTVNNRFNQYMNKKAASAGKAIAGEASKRYKSASGRATSTYNKLSSSARKKASSIYKTGSAYAGKVKSAYDENRKNRKSVAAGKKLIKKHNVNRRIQKRVESDNAVYARALKNARRTIKRRKSN